MRYKQNRGFCPQSKILSAQHKIAAKMQMKKKKTSERKNTQMSFIFHLFFLCLILSMTSCSVKSDYHFDNPHDALGRNFLIQCTTISRKILPLLPTLLCP